jgi:hypothetical protein
VHHPAVVPREAAEAPEVEVEGVEEAGRRLPRYAVPLDDEAALLEFGDERAQELVAAAARRRRELVEDGEVGASTSRPQTIELGGRLAPDRAERTTEAAGGCARRCL